MKIPTRRVIILLIIATCIGLIFPVQSYLGFRGEPATFNWKEQLVQSMTSWYLWAALVPFIFAITRKLRFDSQTRLKSFTVLVLAGAILAAFHGSVQPVFAGWLMNKNAYWHAMSSAFIPTWLARFFNYGTILTVCMALHYYRSARETEILSARAESGILRAQFESLKLRVDPDLVSQKLDGISEMIVDDVDEADTMIAHLGDDLRIKIETPLVFKNFKSQQDDANEIDESTDLEPIDYSNPVRKWLLITGIFTFLAVYFTIQAVILESRSGRPFDWSARILTNAGWYIWALATPVILRLSAHYPLRKPRFLRNLLIHFCGFAVAWFSANLVFAAVKWAANLGQYSYLSQLTLARTFGLDVICYSTIVAVENAIRYHRRFESARLRSLKLNAELARARLQALKMQLHPHFLFNALNSLSQLMREDAEAAQEMIVNLKKFLRLTFNNNHNQEIPLAEELEYLRCYLSIENVRFQDRLRIKMEIDPETLQFPVPNLILQPIVENAIKHGVALSINPGEVEIRACRTNGVLKISVKDDGPGLSQRRKLDSRLGLGLSNTRERLFQLYGDGHHFELTSVPEGGLLVTVEIPISRD